MKLPVGQQDRPRQPPARLLGERLGVRGHQQRALVALTVAERDDAQLGVLEQFDFLAQQAGMAGRPRDPFDAAQLFASVQYVA